MAKYILELCLNWARENRVDCDDDVCDDCTHWVCLV